MLTVGDFATKILEKISAFYPGKIPQDGKTPLEGAHADVLVRYESEWAFKTLYSMLQKLSTSKDDANENSLGCFLTLLEDRWAVISGTDCIPNHSTKTLATRAYLILAEEISEVLSQRDVNNNNNNNNALENKSTYKYLFPGLPEKALQYRKFTDSYLEALFDENVDSQGVQVFKGETYELASIEELQLSEFIWSDRFKASVRDEGDTVVPIVLLSSIDLLLEHIRKNETVDIFPGHTSEARVGSNYASHALLTAESTRIYGHSKVAENYLNAVRSQLAAPQDRAPLSDVLACRDALVKALKSDKVCPKASFKDSREVLLNRQWLVGAAKTIIDSHHRRRDEVKATPPYAVKSKYLDIWMLADFMHQAIMPADWRDFIDALVATNNMLYSVTVPVLHDVLDLDMFEDVSKFEGFIKDCFGLGESDSKFSDYCVGNTVTHGYARALLYILTELYRLIRAGSAEGIYTSTFGTAIGGYKRLDKTNACWVFQEFLADTRYQLDQFYTYCADRTALQAHYKTFNSGRTKQLLDMAIVHGPGLDKKMKSLRSVVEQMLANQKDHGTSWKISLKKIKNDHYLEALTTPNHKNETYSDAFRSLVGNYKNYDANDEVYNRAVLFVLAEIYIRRRGKDSNTMFASSWLSRLQYTREHKVNAVEVFQEFLFDPGKFQLNDFAKYCESAGKSKCVDVMQNGVTSIVKGSDTASLYNQAIDVCVPGYFQQERVKEKNTLKDAGDKQSLRMTPTN